MDHNTPFVFCFIEGQWANPDEIFTHKKASKWTQHNVPNYRYVRHGLHKLSVIYRSPSASLHSHTSETSLLVRQHCKAILRLDSLGY